jgi:hypothetical protein
MLLITIFVELRVVAGRSRTRVGSPQAVSRWPCCAMALRRTAWSEHGMASVNQTRPHCVNQMGKTHSKPLAARHGRGKAWARHAMCGSAFNVADHDPNSYTVICRNENFCLLQLQGFVSVAQAVAVLTGIAATVHVHSLLDAYQMWLMALALSDSNKQSQCILSPGMKR